LACSSLAQSEANLTKIKALPDNEEARDMVQTSIRLHEFVLPVFKADYRELARLYDEDGSQQERVSKAQEIDVKYSAGYQALFNRLVELGKPYAAKHHIKVEWQTRNF
jgi:hypothetical protein